MLPIFVHALGYPIYLLVLIRILYTPSYISTLLSLAIKFHSFYDLFRLSIVWRHIQETSTPIVALSTLRNPSSKGEYKEAVDTKVVWKYTRHLHGKRPGYIQGSAVERYSDWLLWQCYNQGVSTRFAAEDIQEGIDKSFCGLLVEHEEAGKRGLVVVYYASHRSLSPQNQELHLRLLQQSWFIHDKQTITSCKLRSTFNTLYPTISTTSTCSHKRRNKSRGYISTLTNYCRDFGKLLAFIIKLQQEFKQHTRIRLRPWCDFSKFRYSIYSRP